MAQDTKYNHAFFQDIVAPGAIIAARAMLPGVIAATNAKSVVDVGCGNGAWLTVAQSQGCKVHGVDGYATPDVLLIDQKDFEPRDLSSGYDCTGYDLAMSLEVGEHLPQSSAQALVDGLCAADFVLFGAAIPGQGGIGHINEQWQTWWARLFAANGRVGATNIRWDNWEDASIEPYYIANVALYATPERLAAIGHSLPVIDVVHPRLWTYKLGAR